MEKIYVNSLLLDFYGQLLTKRQYEILDFYVNSDYSLSEIADFLDITRQAVFGNIKKSTLILEKLEQKLNLVNKFNKNNEQMREILKDIYEIEKKINLNTNKDLKDFFENSKKRIIFLLNNT